MQYELFVYDAATNNAVATPLADLVASGDNALRLQDGKLFVAPSGVQITSFGQVGNELALSYTDASGTHDLVALAVQGNSLSFDAATSTLTSFVNGVEANIDLSALTAHVDVQEMSWDAANYVLKLTHNGTEHTLNLASLVAVSVSGSVQGDGTTNAPLRLVGDSDTPGALKFYGTDAAGQRGWYSLQGGVGGSVSLKATARKTISLNQAGGDSMTLGAPYTWTYQRDAAGRVIMSANGRPLVIPVYELPASEEHVGTSWQDTTIPSDLSTSFGLGTEPTIPTDQFLRGQTVRLEGVAGLFTITSIIPGAASLIRLGLKALSGVTAGAVIPNNTKVFRVL